MSRLLAIHIIFLFFNGQAIAQVIDSLQVAEPVDSISVPRDTTLIQDTVQTFKQPEEIDPIFPWKEEFSDQAKLITTDSLLRWQIWPNWGDHQAYRSDVISFRQGTIGRVDAYHINGYQPYEQKILLDGLVINDPITGLPNYNLIPHRKIDKAVEYYGGSYRSEIRIRDFYLLKPRSYLIYDEAGGAYRNLEFLVSRNFTQSTNLELSYWDRRGGDYYPNSNVQGNQITGRLYHHLNSKFLLRALYLRNQYNKDEPFGYIIGNPSEFPFDEFRSQPRNSSAKSEINRWDLITGIYHRKDTSSTENAGLEISYSKNNKELFFVIDTLSQNIRSFSPRAFKKMDLGSLHLRVEGRAAFQIADDNTSLSVSDWSIYNGEITADFGLSNKLNLFGRAGTSFDSNDNSGYETVVGVNLNPVTWIKLKVSGNSFSNIPSVQSQFWEGSGYSGNPDLENETGYSGTGDLKMSVNSKLEFGLKGRYKVSQNSVWISSDSSFTNSPDYDQMTGTFYGDFENHLFEFSSSATLQQFNYMEADPLNSPINEHDQILWVRNSAFVKGYVFDRAAYLKMGFKTLLSPFAYGSRTYNTELGIWQGNSIEQDIPPFFRMDAELSARVRGIMVVMRWENALDGFGQAGYFEAAGFPMPPRRLLVGIRAQFRN
ncbi:putative porin [Gracilimonas sp. Q87]|uniref:putative porin n=1 Tax=Gracilimonas sp. Q87 TaxID=3384766 RepID=UPI0039840D0F